MRIWELICESVDGLGQSSDTETCRVLWTELFSKRYLAKRFAEKYHAVRDSRFTGPEAQSFRWEWRSDAWFCDGLSLTYKVCEKRVRRSSDLGSNESEPLG